MSGARRQIFVVFAGFMMVERFGFAVHEVTGLYLINLMVNLVAAPLLGKAVHRFGERRVLIFEYTGLTLVFLCYGGLYWFGWGVLLASVLYVIDHVFFALALALKTYFQKIADPGDIAPPPPWPSPSTTSRRSSCHSCWATSGWSRPARSSGSPPAWRWSRSASPC